MRPPRSAGVGSLVATPSMDLDRALSFSRYADRALAATPALRTELDATLEIPFDWTDAARTLDAIANDGDAATLAAALRTLRRRVFLHTLARDLTGRAPFAEVVLAVTTLAERALGAAVALHTRALAAVHGMPIGDETNAPQRLIVIGMGKLGGGELNVSSDVDLVFAYPEEGETSGPRRISNREFFDRLGQRIIAALSHVDADGYVFRVDMRLRPYGDSGPLTASFSALEQYLVTQGRAWERYAWQKARPLTGERHDELTALISPFVYRRYLDYDAYDGLRGIHRQIREQETRSDYARDVKLGAGGIREIEFIVQALQIVRAGREPALRLRGTLAALAALADRRVVAPHAAGVLHEGYLFLRTLEHRLQYRDDRQTQQLPADLTECAALAEAMGLASTQAFEAAVELHRGGVARQFNAVFAAPGDDAQSPHDRYAAIWEEPKPTPETQAELEGAGFDDPQALVQTLARMRESRRYVQLPARSRERFDRLVPRLLAVAAEQPSAGAPPAVVLQRLLGLLEAVSGRSAYLALLIEHPPLLPRLAHLMGASAWAADYLTRRPLLLDELLDARVLLAEPDWQAWHVELDRLLREHHDDAEAAMDALRHFQHAQTFRLLAQDLAGQMTVERLADHLSALADTVLDATLARCWAQLRRADAPPPRFAIVGYGKLGGKELGYASDLDLVFLYGDDASQSDDAAPEQYARLAQRINTWLTSATGAGRLYATDLRLRPDGAAGLLVSSAGAFDRYQREQAWTWEHQALTRARFVAGDARIGAALESTRESVLRLERDCAKLAADVIDMRARMAGEHVNRTPLFDLKHDAGGMVDIEFAVQFLVLAFAHRHPELTRNAGNIALLQMGADAGLLPRALASEAADSYREYRRLQHQVRLTGAPHARVDAAPQGARRTVVDALWTTVLGAQRQPRNPAC